MNTAAIGNNWIGLVIDRKFTLLQWLGGSEWSDVFLTELHGNPAQKVVIKLIPADAPGVEVLVRGFEAAKNLTHPHVMRLFHSGSCQIDGARLLYAVTEYAEEDLSQIIPERPLTNGEAREMLLPVLDALSYLHSKGVVHGHLKPSNIMVVNNQIKLTSDRLHVGGELGKQVPALKAYDAPEFATRKITPAADVWSVGVTIVEALSQYLPMWDRSSQREPVVQELIPQPFAGIAQDCLWVEPGRRCTLSDIRSHLETDTPFPVAAHNAASSTTAEPIATTSLASDSDARGSAPGKRRLLLLLSAWLLLCAAIAGFYVRSHSARNAQPAATQQQTVTNAGPTPAHPTSAPESTGVPARQTSGSGTAKGEVAERILPNVSHSASSTIRGTVKVAVRVAVDPAGNVTQSTFDSQGSSKYFSRVALEAARQWKFKPAQVAGNPVASAWVLQFQFRQSGVNVIPTEVSP